MVVEEVVVMGRSREALVIPLDPGEREAAGGETAPAERDHAVFMSDFLHISRSFGVLSRLMLDPGGPWLRAAERSAADERFVLTAGQPRQYDAVVVVPVHWEPARVDGGMPALDADVELSSLGAGLCRLSLSGRYRLPGRRQADSPYSRAVQRAAEAAARGFLSEVGGVFEDARSS